MSAAVGFVAKTGWALGVVVTGPVEEPAVAARLRLELVGEALPANVFHVAADLPLDDARRLARQVSEAAARVARRTVPELADQHGVSVVGVVGASGAGPDDVAAIVRSHALVHAAEGELVREALAEGAGAAGVPVVRIRRADLGATAERVLGLGPEALRAALVDLGRPVGPPWRQEQRDAALVAWLARAG